MSNSRSESRNRREILPPKKHSNQLDRDNLRELIRILQIADKYKFGLSSLSSPIDLLFDAILDLLLIVRTQLVEGARSRSNNPSILFSDRIQDVLGNPQQVSWRKQPTHFWDPEASDWITALASTLVQVKTGTRFKEAFMASFEYLISDDYSCLSKQENVAQNLRHINTKSLRAGRHWYRRQHKSNQKSH